VEDLKERYIILYPVNIRNSTILKVSVNVCGLFNVKKNYLYSCASLPGAA